MKKIVVTGGPCGGKSTVLDVLRNQFASQVVVVPEVATILLEGGFPVPGRDVDWSPEWQVAFQSAILPVQLQMENAYVLKAKQKGINLLICDRGLLDGAAYTPGGAEAFCNEHDLDHDEVMNRYALIMHLESLATGNPELYGKTNNAVRFEDLEEAIKLEHSTRIAWQDHPCWNFVTSKNSLEKNIATICQMVRNELV